MTDKPRVERPDEIDPRERDRLNAENLILEEWLKQRDDTLATVQVEMETLQAAHDEAVRKITELQVDRDTARQDGWDAAIQAAGLAIAARAENWESLPAETRHIINLIARDIRALKMPEEVPKMSERSEAEKQPQPCPQCKGTGDQWNPIRGLIMAII